MLGSDGTGDDCDNDEEVRRIFDGIDVYHDGAGIAYTEFLAATLTSRGFLTEERVAEAFDRLDLDSSGAISVDDLHSILGRNFTEEYANEIIAQVDVDRDGKLSYQEFLRVFRNDSDKLAEVTL
jgi:Ca2+-binding EF-hand superfamily protein